MAMTIRSPRDAMMAAMAAATLVLEAALLGGCGCSNTAVDGNQAAAPGDDGPATVPARPDARSYTFAHKSQFITDMSAELATISRDFDRLFPKVENSNRFIQSVAIPAIDELRGLSAALYRQLEEAATTSAEAWPAFTATFTKDLGELRDGLERSRQKISETSSN